MANDLTAKASRHTQLEHAPRPPYPFALSHAAQFTLNGRVCKKGKVDFTGSMPPAEAEDFYGRFVQMVEASHAPQLVKNGVFGAKMEVSLVNDGPITVTVDSSEMTT